MCHSNIYDEQYNTKIEMGKIGSLYLKINVYNHSIWE